MGKFNVFMTFLNFQVVQGISSQRKRIKIHKKTYKICIKSRKSPIFRKEL